MTHERSGVCREQTPKPTLMVGKKISIARLFACGVNLSWKRLQQLSEHPCFVQTPQVSGHGFSLE